MRTRKLLIQLDREDHNLRSRLCEAAVAGAELAQNPSDQQCRQHVEYAWRALQPLIYYVKSEEDAVLKWAENRGFQHELIDRGRGLLPKLRRLAHIVDGAAFIEGADASVRSAGHALCTLALHLQDLIDSEQHALFPMLNCKLVEVAETSIVSETVFPRHSHG